ncbi:P-loop containing nucleoside triphosphate hydrolase protein [Absidia repens]|uniref:p-loop containing nucleoside triphosphate hydrolase protein n=1 Tax=Absidia repens TaxID=90262 RepID=A0A1X2I0C7_9FUNG|nr:P-loop containing nucleoside triphosphate hydrolase protein [Absidia repens]
MRVITVGISGASCSGKTTITRVLQQLVKQSIIIYQDDYFRPDQLVPIDPTTQLANWDCPEALDFDRFASTIQYVQQHGCLPAGYHSNEVSNTHDGSTLVTNDQLAQWKHQLVNDDDNTLWLFVDGFMLLSDPKVTDLLDHKVFVTASYDTLKQRRQDRQGYHTLEGYWVDPPGYFDAIVWPEFLRAHQHVPGPHQQHQQQQPSSEEESHSRGLVVVNTDLLDIPQSLDKVVNALWS